MSINAVKHIIATVFSAQNALRELAPDFNWAGMGNLLGDYGEYLCIENYNLTKAPRGSAGFDAITEDERTVQIKTNHASSSIGFRGAADLMLVIHVADDGEFEELYFGDFKNVKGISGLFQNNFKVYDRENKSCVRKNCKGKIIKIR